MKKRVIILVSMLILCLNFQVFSNPVKAPSFALINNKGKYTFKSKLKGNLLVSFWASYCGPCRKEMPMLIELEKKYGKSKNLNLILINTDSGSKAKKKAEKFLKDINVKHDYLIDNYQITLKKYNPKLSVPSTFLVNKKGILSAFWGNLLHKWCYGRIRRKYGCF